MVTANRYNLIVTSIFDLLGGAQKRIMILPFCILVFLSSYSQKKLIDSSMFGKWPMTVANLSSNGRFMYTSIIFPSGNGNSLLLQSLDSSWKLKIEGASGCVFSSDSKYAVSLTKKQMLLIISLDVFSIDTISEVEEFNLVRARHADWLLYQKHNASREIHVRHMMSKKETIFKNVVNYFEIPCSDFIVFQTEDRQKRKSLLLSELVQNSKYQIWEGSRAKKVISNVNGTAFAFIGETTDSGGTITKSVWYFNLKKKLLHKLELDTFNRRLQAISISDVVSFSIDGSRLYIKLNLKKATRKTDPTLARVDIWNYQDMKLQSQQLKDLKDNSERSFLFVYNLNTKKLVQLENENAFMVYPPQRTLSKINGDHVLVQVNGGGDLIGEFNWNKTALSSLYLVSTKDGNKTMVVGNLPQALIGRSQLSPEGKYVIYYNADKRQYFSYNVTDGKRKCISERVKTIWTTSQRDDEPIAKFSPIGIAGWFSNDSALVVYDQNDVYILDPQNERPPRSITLGIGRKLNMQFRLVPLNMSTRGIISSDTLILSAFDLKTKKDGFYKAFVKERRMELLTMQPFHFTGLAESSEFGTELIKKADYADVYLIKYSTAANPLNYLLTKDLKKFQIVTDCQPQRDFIWMNSTLITWENFDGHLNQGILYKPDNFDSSKKYPVIFYYYERYSEGLHYCLSAGYSDHAINIPYYVSNGYIVVVPDIHFNLGYPGRSAYSSVVSAAKHISKYPWVDSKRLGLNGHSFGAFETNYIVAHTTLFAAASSAEGWANSISIYNGIRLLNDGSSRQSGYELRRQRVGVTLWESPQLYLENSAILQAHRVVTPVLLMHNSLDADIPFEYGVEFFNALRRLGKRSWMLQYDGQDHTLDDEKAIKDYTIRMKQFFDHYLKDSACPRWMLYGIPASMKGVDNGYELVKEKDSKTGKWITPKEGGLLTDEEKKKVEALKYRKPVTVTIE